LKLSYHKKNNWEEEYITEARKTISDLYENQYAPVINDAVEENESDDDIFNHMYKKRRASHSESELNLYLESQIVPSDVDLLQWWKV